WSKKADFGVNTSEFWSNENFKREQAGYDEGAIHLFAPSLTKRNQLITFAIHSSNQMSESQQLRHYHKTEKNQVCEEYSIQQQSRHTVSDNYQPR
ncbi:hypothetical protein ACE1BJ_23565, partial [Aeromonas jandaei]